VESKARVAWITGGGTGIGRELALRLAAHGWQVAVSGRRPESLAEVAATGPSSHIHPYPLDVTDAGANRSTLAAIESSLGPVDLAVFNAGAFRPFKASEFDTAPFEELVRVNYLGVVNGIAAVVPGMRLRGHGHVAIVASVAGYNGLPLGAPYGATKAALINLAESLRFDFRRMGLDISIINPGFVRTPLTEPNRFHMPFLMNATTAARHIERGLQAKRFEIAFPWPMVMMLKVARILPYWLSFPLLRLYTRR
jgi:NAD(P)-dependent dehydrogenase (short-subunit alcohol dehydrogenase family)